MTKKKEPKAEKVAKETKETKVSKAKVEAPTKAKAVSVKGPATKRVGKVSKVAKVAKIAKDNLSEASYGTGRRKEAVARVWLKSGSGRIIVNGKEITQYFARPVLNMVINQPLQMTGAANNVDIYCTVKGGGLSGQAGAVRHGISRALDQHDETTHKTLRQNGFLTRDSRVVERKKYGRAKARKKFQFSKR